MKSRDLIEALVAVLGVYELVQGLASIPIAVLYIASPNLEWAQSWSVIASTVVPLLLGGALLKFRGSIAERLASAPPDDVLEVPGDLVSSLLAVAGVYLIVIALVNGAAVATGDILQADFLNAFSSEGPGPHVVWPPRIRVLVQLALGLVLAIRSTGVASLIESLRGAGHRRSTI